MTTVEGRVAVSRRPVNAADIPLLRNLFADAHLELTVLPCDTRFVLIDMQFRAQRRQYAAKYPSAAHDILLVDGVEVGRVVVDHTDDAIQVVDISIGLGHRRAGIAGAVLGGIAREADASALPVKTTVWGGNTAAVALLETAGFRSAGNDAGFVSYVRGSGAVTR
jgi:RimJ/RimL family protein N-acetyltransferase